MSKQVMEAKITYFKKSGKMYHGDETLQVEGVSFFEAVEKIKELHKKGKLPGLDGGGREFYVHIEIKFAAGDGEYTLPHLLFPTV